MPYSVAVAGASGYAGGEALRLLSAHPELEVRTATAHSNAGQRLIDVNFWINCELIPWMWSFWIEE